MSPRAAARLEALGFQEVYDYVAGKADWGAAGLPLEGTIGPRAGDVADRDVPTCRLDERLQPVRERVAAGGWDTCIVTRDDGVVLGRLGRRALTREDDVSVEEAMSPGPSTVRPSLPLEELERRMQEKNLRSYLVTTSDGKLVGIVRRAD